MVDSLKTPPSVFTAGDTFSVTREHPDYAASASWSAKLTISSATTKYTITGTASGDAHLLLATAATTQSWIADNYQWQETLTKAGERVTTASGRITIAANLEGAAGGLDVRSPAKKCLDAVEVALATYGKKAYTQEYEIAGRRAKFSNPVEFMNFRARLRAEVAAEEQAAAIARGESPKNKIYVRF